MSAPPPVAGYVAFVAAKMGKDSASVIDGALETLRRWRAQGQTNPHRLDAWERLLREARAGGMEALLHAMQSDDPASARLRDFHPFHGLLTREERRAACPPCAFKH